MLPLEDIPFYIMWLGVFSWIFWYITIPIGMIFIFMASRKRAGKVGKIIYSACALLFLLPLVLGPLSAPFISFNFGVFPPSID
ncbi:hypothetical protein [Xenorhabdus sp. TH1]|uniref:hypothetical protein n=1 Tax=Xenorhabdus sp. TH1 TaxID=3130166 RepID=UPI0030CD770A